MMQLMNSIKKDRLNLKEQLEFLDYLKNSLDNGFSLNSSIELMEVLWPQKKALMHQLDTKMKNGSYLHTELLNLGFSKTTVTQINLAIQQGSLIECLTQLVILNRLKIEQIKKLKSELSYPFVLFTMMIFLLIFMQTFVSSQFNDSNEHAGDIIIVGLIIIVMGSMYYFAKILTLLAKQDYDSMKKLSRYPLLGKVVKNYVNYLLIYDIGLLLAGGFSLQKMCEYAQSQEKGSLQQYLGEKVGKDLADGKNLQEIIKKEEFLPDSLLVLLQTGSKRKNLSNRCLILGKSLFNELTSRIEKLVVNVQPFCFILIGLCVIGMYLKLLLPMYAMMRGL